MLFVLLEDSVNSGVEALYFVIFMQEKLFDFSEFVEESNDV